VVGKHPLFYSHLGILMGKSASDFLIKYRQGMFMDMSLQAVGGNLLEYWLASGLLIQD
jgi:hypothetical protein